LTLDGDPKPDLVKVKDYRGVNCKVYALYAEIYGTDDVPANCRFIVDLYAPPVVGNSREELLKGPLLESRVVAQVQRSESGNRA